MNKFMTAGFGRLLEGPTSFWKAPSWKDPVERAGAGKDSILFTVGTLSKSHTPIQITSIGEGTGRGRCQHSVMTGTRSQMVPCLEKTGGLAVLHVVTRSTARHLF
jgi:hypothetical protein